MAAAARPVTRKAGFGAGAAWSMLDNLAQQVLSFAIFVVLARFLLPEHFGILAVAHLMLGAIRQVVFDAIALPAARAAQPDDALYSRTFRHCAAVGLLLGGVMAAAAGGVARLYGQPELEPVLRWMSLAVVCVGCARAYEARLARQMAFRVLAIRSIVSVSIGGLVGILLALRGHGVMALVAQQVVGAALALLMLVAQAGWVPRLRGGAEPATRERREVAHVGLSGLMNFLTTNGDILLVSILLGSHATGLYNFAKRITSAVYLVVGSSMIKVAITAFAEALDDGPHGLRKAYVRVLGVTLFVMAPVLAGLGALAVPLIDAVFGPVWAPAAPLVAVLGVLHLMLAVHQTNDYLLFAVGRRRVPVLRGVLQVALAAAFASVAAAAGAGVVAVSLAFVAASVLVWPWAQHSAAAPLDSGFLSLAGALKAPLLAAAAMLAALVPLAAEAAAYLPPWAVVAAGAGVGALAYLLAYLLITRLSRSSYDAVGDLLRLRRTS